VLDTLPVEQAAFIEDGMFAQSMTGNPYSCVALDIWIESTMNKGSKLKSGWLAILNNEKQVLSNNRNVNNVNRVRAIFVLELILVLVFILYRFFVCAEFQYY